jgi:23S rRNA (pseudouridine1915-N3)-methyltransferase
MVRLRIVAVGKTESGFIKDGVEHYLKRLRALHPVEWEEVRAAAHSGRAPAQVLAAEAAALLKRVGANDRLILLHERGKLRSSPELAQWLEALHRTEASAAVIAIGGAYGVSEDVRQRADEELSLSSMTFPHQLVRLILLEQMYRAATILAGQPYHHG